MEKSRLLRFLPQPDRRRESCSGNSKGERVWECRSRDPCHELRIPDKRSTWRIVYRLDPDAVVILEVFSKKTRATPNTIIKTCQTRLKRYDEACQS